MVGVMHPTPGPLETSLDQRDEIISRITTPRQDSPYLHVLLAGGVGGAIGDSTMYPLDTVKTRQQGAPNNPKYKLMWDAARTISREEGILRGIYSGCTPAILGSFPSTLAFFGLYEYIKRESIDTYHIPETLSHLLSGFIGDLGSSFIYVPSEVLKTRFQLQGKYNNPYNTTLNPLTGEYAYNYRGLGDAIRTIAKEEGIGALFYGYKATLIRDLPFSALQLAFYEKFHGWAKNLAGYGNEMGIALELGTGALAGGLAGILTTPLDVIKTRVQTQGPSTHATSHSSVDPPKRPTSPPVIVANSTIGGLRAIFRQEGLAGLFAGVGPRLVWSSIQSSIMLLVYQYTLKILDHGENTNQDIF